MLLPWPISRLRNIDLIYLSKSHQLDNILFPSVSCLCGPCAERFVDVVADSFVERVALLATETTLVGSTSLTALVDQGTLGRGGGVTSGDER